MDFANTKTTFHFLLSSKVVFTHHFLSFFEDVDFSQMITIYLRVFSGEKTAQFVVTLTSDDKFYYKIFSEFD